MSFCSGIVFCGKLPKRTLTYPCFTVANGSQRPAVPRGVVGLDDLGSPVAVGLVVDVPAGSGDNEWSINVGLGDSTGAVSDGVELVNGGISPAEGTSKLGDGVNPLSGDSVVVIVVGVPVCVFSSVV